MELLLIPLIALAIQYWVNEHVQETYIDEYFHLGMTQKYLVEQNFTYWDPKITTPPGLYFLGYSFGKLIEQLIPVDFEGPQIYYLRFLNR